LYETVVGLLEEKSKIVLSSRKGMFQRAANVLVHLITRNSSPPAGMHSEHELNQTYA
jgi:hypothetical protein